jgi:hypothetical protein
MGAVRFLRFGLAWLAAGRSADREVEPKEQVIRRPTTIATGRDGLLIIGVDGMAEAIVSVRLRMRAGERVATETPVATVVYPMQ